MVFPANIALGTTRGSKTESPPIEYLLKMAVEDVWASDSDDAPLPRRSVLEHTCFDMRAVYVLSLVGVLPISRRTYECTQTSLNTRKLCV